MHAILLFALLMMLTMIILVMLIDNYLLLWFPLLINSMHDRGRFSMLGLGDIVST